MYTRFFGLQHAPFSIAPDPRFLYLSERHREALAHLHYGMGAGGGFVVLTGEIGAGKTTVCRCMVEQIPADCRLAYLFNPELTVRELLETVCHEFGIARPEGPGEPGSTKPLIDALNLFLLDAHARGLHCVLVIDEAQRLSMALLEQLRLLTNLETHERKLLQIVLIGQPELREMLARPELEQLAQRVIARFHLGPLDEAETEAYVRHRLAVAGLEGAIPFDAAALRHIHRHSRGVPRRINLLCDRALLGGYADGQGRIGKGIVDQAAREVFEDRPHPSAPPTRGRWMLLGGGLALAGAVIGWTAWQQAATPRPLSAGAGPQGAAAAASSPSTKAPTPAGSAPLAAGSAPAMVGPAPAASDTAGTQATHAGAATSTSAASGAMAAASPSIAASRTSAPATPPPAVTSNTVTPTPGVSAPAAQASAATARWLDEASWHDWLARAPRDAAVAWRELAGSGLPAHTAGTSLPAHTAGDPCAALLEQGRLCLRRRGTLALLRELGGPALLWLSTTGQATRVVLLVQLSGQAARLRSGGDDVMVPLTLLAQAWRDDYALLWQPPAEAVVDGAGRVVSIDVGWLTRRLVQAAALPASAASSATLATLRPSIEAFQRARGLPADGQVGALTLIHLQKVATPAPAVVR